MAHSAIEQVRMFVKKRLGTATATGDGVVAEAAEAWQQRRGNLLHRLCTLPT